MKINDSNSFSNNNIPSSGNNLIKSSQRHIINSNSRDSSNSNVGSGHRISINDLDSSIAANEINNKYAPDNTKVMRLISQK